MDGHAAGLLALGVEVVDDGLDGLGHRTHSHDDVLGILGTVVGEGGVLAAGQLADLSHILGHDVGQGVVVLVLQLAGLEIDVAVLGGTAGHVVLGVEGVLAESLQGLLVHQRTQVFHIPSLDFLDLVAGAEAVEEVEERHAALEGGEVGHRGEVHHLLHRALGQQGEARLAGAHHVGVVAEDGEGLGGEGAGAHVEHAGQQFAGDLVHVGDHQQQTLRSGVGGGQSTGLQRAVHGAGGAGLALHLDDLHGLAEEVLTTAGGPLVDILGHRAGRGDGVDSCYLAEHVGYCRRSAVTVASHKFRVFSCEHHLSLFFLQKYYFSATWQKKISLYIIH